MPGAVENVIFCDPASMCGMWRFAPLHCHSTVTVTVTCHCASTLALRTSKQVPIPQSTLALGAPAMPRNALRIFRHQCIGRLASNNANSPVGGFVCMHLSVGARVRSSDRLGFSTIFRNLSTTWKPRHVGANFCPQPQPRSPGCLASSLC